MFIPNIYFSNKLNVIKGNEKKMNEYNDIQNYYHCLEKFGKFFNIKDNNNHSDSNTDSNSDNNSENSLDIKNDNSRVKNSLIKDIFTIGDNFNSIKNGRLF